MAKYTFQDGSYIDLSKLQYGEHACDGTIIPVVASVTRRKSYTVNASIPWSETVSDSVTMSNRWYQNTSVNTQTVTSGNGLSLTCTGQSVYSGGLNLRGSATFSKTVSGTATKTYTGETSYIESAIFLPLHFSSLSKMSTYKDGVAKAWIKK